MKNVLLLTANTGGGHNSAANALKTYVEKNKNNINLSVVDYYKYIDPQLSKLSSTTYEVCAKNLPHLYKASYNFKNLTPSKDAKFSIPIFNLKLKNLIKEYNPDIIIVLHPSIIADIVNLRKHYHYSYKVFVLMTDFNFHEGWVFPDVDCYIVSNNFMRLRLLEKKISEDKILCYGIPTSYKFAEKISKNESRKILGLKNMTTILLMGGSFGAGKIQKILKKIVESDLDIQIIAVAGKDLNLEKDLNKLKNKYNKFIQILGFVNNIYTYMDASDILVTKPGGLTITEALIKQLPMIIVNPIPGQEEENANFLLNKGIAITALNKNIVLVLKDLLEDKDRFKNMKMMSQIYAKPNACKNIIEYLISYNLNK